MFNFPWEASFLLWIQNAFRWSPMDPLWIGITYLGEKGIFFIVLSLVLIAIPKTRKAGHIALFTIIIGFTAGNLVLKNVFGRIRPYEIIQGLTILIEKQPDASFPSGHTIVAFAFGFTAFRYLPKKLGVPALILAFLVSFSRLYIGVHYPTDVLGGIAVAWLSMLLSSFSEQKLAARCEKQRTRSRIP